MRLWLLFFVVLGIFSYGVNLQYGLSGGAMAFGGIAIVAIILTALWRMLDPDEDKTLERRRQAAIDRLINGL